MISTVTQPLLGAVDTAVLGHLEDASFMGGVAIGAVVFNTMYWLFGFLRVSTSGISAQSLGSGIEKDKYYSYMRSAIIAIIIGVLLLFLQIPIRFIVKLIYKLEFDVESYFLEYYRILIWGAPFVLLGYVNLGWLMGRTLVKETMILQISMNLVNILLDFILVVLFHKGVYGVAVATLTSQIYGFLLGTFFILRKLKLKKIVIYIDGLLDFKIIKKIISVNSDLFIRTVCLLIMTNMFMFQGSSLGKHVLAANAILFQIQYIIAYLYDGLSNASSVFSGRAVGRKNFQELKKVFKISNISIFILTIIITILSFIASSQIIHIFTSIEPVYHFAIKYRFWLYLFPLSIGIGLVYSGIYLGCFFTVPIRNSMILSLILFILSYFILIPFYGNNGLWLSFIIFSLGRSLFLLLYKNRLFKTLCN